MTILRKALFIFLLLVGTCFAAENPKLIGYPPNQILGFRGLDTRSMAPMLGDSRAVDCQNVKLSGALDLMKRYGYDPVFENLDDWDLNDPENTRASPAITGIFDAHYSDGTNKILAFIGDKVKYSGTLAWTEIKVDASSPITSGTNNQWQCKTALDYAVCTNDADKPIKIDKNPHKSYLDTSTGSLASNTISLTKAKSVTWYRNYLVFANTVEGAVEKPTRFRWSNVGTIETFDDDDFIDIAELGGDEIVALVELYGDLYALLKSSIYKISLVGGDDLFLVTKVIENIGCISRDSVQVVTLSDNRRAVVFLDDDKKVYLYNGAVLTDIGSKIQPTLDGLNATRLPYASSVFDGTDYYLSVSNGTSTENNLTLDFQTEIGEWTKHTDLNANAMARVKTATSVVRTYFGNYDGFVYWLDNPDNKNDGDQGITGVVESVGTMRESGLQTTVQCFIDTTPGFGDQADGLDSFDKYTGSVFKITAGTGVGEEQVITQNSYTMVCVGTAFTTTPDATSNYSIGAIDASYQTKWYDYGSSPRLKSFRKMFIWAEEASNNEVEVSYAEDFGTTLGSESLDLSPTSSSLWDSALWDVGTWGTTGDKFYTIPLKGAGRSIQFKFENSDVNETFHLYGIHMLADILDTE